MIRVLDPATAVVRPDQEIGETAYVSDRLLVRGDQPLQLDDRVAGVLKELGLGLRPRLENGERVLPRWRLRDRKLRIESEQVVGLELHVIDPRGAPAPDEQPIGDIGRVADLLVGTDDRGGWIKYSDHGGSS